MIRMEMKNGEKLTAVEADPMVGEVHVLEVLVLRTRFIHYNVNQIENFEVGPKASLEDPGKLGNIIKISN